MMDFDPNQLAQDVAADMVVRLQGLPLSEEELADNEEILHTFTNIATNMLIREPDPNAQEPPEQPGIPMPGADGNVSLIPLDAKTFVQALSLFDESLIFAIGRCNDMRITGEAKHTLLQNLALNIYDHAKQIVATTYGQESTPQFQIPHDQQVALINQTADSALLYYLNEYEKQFGPIHGDEEGESDFLSDVETTQTQAPAPSMPPPAPNVPSAPPPPLPYESPVETVTQSVPSKPIGPTAHDKYGAVALLMSTLPADQRARILKSFNPAEKELIAYYSYPQHIEHNLDLASVQAHLKRFKETLKQGGGGLKSAASRGLSRLAQRVPREKLLSYVKDERPRIRLALEAYCGAPMEEHAAGSDQEPYFDDDLPPRIEEILYSYLSRRLEPAG